MTFIEGGWPGANPKDEEFFARAPAELSPRRRPPWWPSAPPAGPGVRAEDDETLRHLVKAKTEAVCIVAKSSEMHVVDALRTTLDEAVAMVADSVAFLRANDLRVFLDAEHFFDGYKANPEFTLRILQAAEEAGAETLVLCDTNGGTLPYEVERIVGRRCSAGSRPRSASTSTTTAAARWPTRWPRVAGRRHPRPGLRQRLRRAGRQRRPVRRHPRPVAQAAGVRPSPPTGSSASPRCPTTSPSWSTSPPTPSSPTSAPSVFAHKAGLHTSAIARRSDAYEHISPDLVGQRHPLRRVGDGRTVDPGPQGGGARASSSTRRP